MSRLLLDTCAFLWWQADDARLNQSARGTIQDASEVFISAASAWEVAIKLNLGRLRVPEPVSSAVEAYGFVSLSITMEHAELAGALPKHHADPFDRLLVAQAQVESLVLVTADEKLRPYSVTCLWL